jgi:O-succinylbenzoate synthase
MHPKIEINSFNVKRIKVNLKKPILVFGKIYSVRELLILKINETETEIAPLPGIHLLDIEQEEKDLIDFLKNNKTISLDKLNDIRSTALRFALRCLFYPDIDPANCFRAHSFISDLTNIPLNLSPYCLKIKISPDIIENNWKILDTLFKEIPTRKFRLDANQSFTAKSLIQLDLKLKPYSKQIDYLEEPLNDLQLWNKLNLAYPLALDESLRDFDFSFMPLNLTTIIMRPSTQTQFETEVIIKNATKNKLKIVIGSCYEGKNGIENILKFIYPYQNVFSFDQGIDFLLN